MTYSTVLSRKFIKSLGGPFKAGQQVNREARKLMRSSGSDNVVNSEMCGQFEDLSNDYILQVYFNSSAWTGRTKV